MSGRTIRLSIQAEGRERPRSEFSQPTATSASLLRARREDFARLALSTAESKTPKLL